MCPTMMDEPTAPGRGLPVYQPATVVEDGTCIEPPGARPRVIRLVFTPISGMVSEIGLGTWAAATGGRAGVGCRVSNRPAVPPTITTRPAAKAIAAGLRSGIPRPRCSSDAAARDGAA